ncbi:MAG: pyruvate kinase [Anaerolineae bacterium]|nr:pyruvate kinase [Anaerolineae bacterium]
MRRAKIVCTIGPASRDPDVLEQIIQSGMDVARLNLSHDDHYAHTQNIQRIRAAAGKLNKPVAILVDLQGPKLRVGQMDGDGVLLHEGEMVTLTTDNIVGRSGRPLPVQYHELPSSVQARDRILLDDGLLELRVLSTTAREIRCEVVVGGMLKTNKGMNLPRTPPGIKAITDKDRLDLAFALEQQVDWIALSFVCSAGDVHELKQLIHSLAPGRDPIPVVAKIEKPEALESIDEIIAAADGIMVARGDLGVEIPPEEVPLAQKQIIQACNQAGVPVITATQMLDSMIHNPRPTRAEVSDVANAILDGTDAIMLSGETSVGAYPLQAVQTMDRIACQVEKQREQPLQEAMAYCEATILDSEAMLLSKQHNMTIASAVTRAAREIAHSLDTSAIITPTTSGYTARLMSRDRPRCPIIATTSSPIVQRRLSLYWGVTPLPAPRAPDTDTMITQAIRAALENDLIRHGDTVVITAGASGSAPGTTNLIRIHVVSGDGMALGQ